MAARHFDEQNVLRAIRGFPRVISYARSSRQRSDLQYGTDAAESTLRALFKRLLPLLFTSFPHQPAIWETLLSQRFARQDNSPANKNTTGNRCTCVRHRGRPGALVHVSHGDNASATWHELDPSRAPFPVEPCVSAYVSGVVGVVVKESLLSSDGVARGDRLSS